MSKLKLLLLSILFFLNTQALCRAESPFLDVSPGRTLQYPRDFGAHPDYATEWWYTTGHLLTEAGSSFGFELVFFRVGIEPHPPSFQSAWRTDSLYLAHFALTDDSNKSFVHFERKSRGNFREAGAAPDTLNVWLKDWSLRLRDDKLEIRANENGTGISLDLQIAKPLVLHGDNGYSVKGQNRGESSYYASYTHLVGSGTVTSKGETSHVSQATGWFDQEFTSSKISRGTTGWDWFALRCEQKDKTSLEIMLYQLRDASGAPTKFSSGTIVYPNGSAEHLTEQQFQVEITDYWLSPDTKIRYPSGWILSLPEKKIRASLKPTVANQELITSGSTGVTYWEGRTRGNAEQQGEVIPCEAYVELVGYSQS